MRSPNCTSACWMWRGCLSSLRYSRIFVSERWRPNQVLHQNRNGMSTISQATRKKSRRLRVDMRWRPGRGGESSTAADRFAVSEVSVRVAMFVLSMGSWILFRLRHRLAFGWSGLVFSGGVAVAELE